MSEVERRDIEGGWLGWGDERNSRLSGGGGGDSGSCYC